MVLSPYSVILHHSPCPGRPTWLVLDKHNKPIDSNNLGIEWYIGKRLGDARGSFLDIPHASTKCFETAQKQWLFLLTLQLAIATHHLPCPEGPSWPAWLKIHKHIDSEHLFIEWCIRGRVTPEEASQTFHVHPIFIWNWPEEMFVPHCYVGTHHLTSPRTVATYACLI